MDGNRTEFDAFDRSLRRGIALKYLYPIEPGILERTKKFTLLQCARDASGPQLWIVFQMRGNRFIRNDV